MRILFVDDEMEICEAVCYLLRKNNYDVDIANDGDTAADMALTGIYNIVILDLMLPGKDGISILKEIRKNGFNTPVLILSAKDAIQDRVKGLDAGADDYLVKPFSTEELLARIRALSRRQGEVIQDKKIEYSNITFIPSQSELICGEKKLRLTFKENQLFELFMRNKNKIIAKEVILDYVWGLDKYVDMNNVEIYVYHLRRKLSSINSKVNIETVRGLGYILKEV